MKLQLDCHDVSRLLSRQQDETLPPAERARLRLHLVICQTCRNVEEQFDFIRRAMARLGHDDDGTGPPSPPPAPPPG